ncbi:MAG: hypothetical protein ACYTAS_18755 [Planctomycetota bacterium]|jgi:hypothetical protein
MKSSPEYPWGYCVAARGLLCLILAFTLGCRSVYRLRCTSNPTPAGVLVNEECLGETACTIEIPRDSEWIQDGQIELTFCLPDGERKACTVDLREHKPSNPLAETAASPFLLCGVGMLAISDDEEDNDGSLDGSDDDDEKLGWLGLGAMGLGAGLYVLLGGDFESLSPCHVHVDFTEVEVARE